MTTSTCTPFSFFEGVQRLQQLSRCWEQRDEETLKLAIALQRVTGYPIRVRLYADGYTPVIRCLNVPMYWSENPLAFDIELDMGADKPPFPKSIHTMVVMESVQKIFEYHFIRVIPKSLPIMVF